MYLAVVIVHLTYVTLLNSQNIDWLMFWIKLAIAWDFCLPYVCASLSQVHVANQSGKHQPSRWDPPHSGRPFPPSLMVTGITSQTLLELCFTNLTVLNPISFTVTINRYDGPGLNGTVNKFFTMGILKYCH